MTVHGAPDSGAGARNLSAFSEPATVDDYARTAGLTPAERALVERFAPPAPQVLDLGVGTGRTTGELRDVSSGYVGIDLSPAMVARARLLHPTADLRVGDAADLGELDTASFDLVLFSYHGIDYLHPDDSRHRCLGEVARVLRPGGVFIASRHSPRTVVRRPATPLTPRSAAIAIYQTARLLRRRARQRAVWRGEGYELDPVRGGLVTHYAVPGRVVAEIEAAGFRHLQTLPTDHPRRPNRLASSWYYAFERRPVAEDATAE